MRQPADLAPAIPQPRPKPLLGNATDVGTERPVQELMRLAREHGPLFRLEFPSARFLVASSHALVDELSDDTRFEKHVHGPLRFIRDLAGDGLFTAFNDEPNWARAHRILLPAFGPGAMKTYFDAMLDVAEQLVTKWERLGPDAVHDVPDAMTRLTLDTIALCGFGYRFNSFYQREMHPFVDAMVRALAEAGERPRRLPVQTRLMLLTQRRYGQDVAYMNQVADELIAERKRHPLPPGQQRDLLSLMLEGRDPVTGEGLDDVNIRYQMVTFLIAGHETTSGLLSFTLYALSRHPEVLARARAEVDRVLGDAAAPRFEQLSQLPYLDAVLRESLRVWPTAPAFAVRPKQDTLLAGRYPLTRDDYAMVLTPMLHRDPAVWGADPERFDPERFLGAARERVPANAWKPFGTGDRACIGRPFAMQEALLVLAMLLRRFDLEADPRYALKIKETLTLKPEGFTLRARVRTDRPAPTRAPSAATTPAPAPAAVASAPRHGTPLLVLFGSNTGASEAFARRIAADAAARGWAPEVAAMDERTGELPTRGALVVVTASYNGHPPDNARRFVSWLDGLAPGALSGVRYAVFGCGNRDWAATYQAVPTRVDERLAAAGAERLLARGEADARADFFGDFDAWYTPVWDSLGKAFGLEQAGGPRGPLYEVERLDSPQETRARQNGLALATVLESRELVDLGSPFGRSKRHVELALPEGLTYRAGDYLAVLPVNDPERVQRAARRLGLDVHAQVRLKAAQPAAASLPTDVPLTVGELLGEWVELAAPATRKQLERLAAATRCPPHKAQLAGFALDEALYRAEILDKRVSVLDLLEEYPAVELSFAELLEMLPPLRPRQYSISSSPRAGEGRCTLTVSVLDAPALSGRGRHRGVASNYLARVRPGTRLAVQVRSPTHPFHPPERPELPIVMACAGSGLAPFRGFLEERAHQKRAGEHVGPALLFFGCDHPDVDFLYREELERWEAEGVVQVLPAFFRAPVGDVMFVQHRLWQERARVAELLAQGAHVYVCGDGARMAPAVRDTLVRIGAEAGGCDLEEARHWLEALEREGRYVADVFA